MKDSIANLVNWFFKWIGSMISGAIRGKRNTVDEIKESQDELNERLEREKQEEDELLENMSPDERRQHWLDHIDRND